MKKDFELLKKDTEVVYGGIRTNIEGGVIVKLMSNYMLDVWGYLTEKYPGKDFSEGEAWDYDPRFLYTTYDGVGDEFVVLSLKDMSEDEIDWEYDYVRIDTGSIPSYLRDMNTLVPLVDIDLPRSIYDLSRDELISLREQICIGSIFFSNFNNDKFVPRDEVLSESESFIDAQHDKYGDEGYDDHLTAEEFADYFCDAA